MSRDFPDEMMRKDDLWELTESEGIGRVFYLPPML